MEALVLWLSLGSTTDGGNGKVSCSHRGWIRKPLLQVFFAEPFGSNHDAFEVTSGTIQVARNVHTERVTTMIKARYNHLIYGIPRKETDRKLSCLEKA